MLALLTSAVRLSGQGTWHQFETQLPTTMPDVAFNAPASTLDPNSSDHNDPNVAVVEFDEKGALWPCDSSVGPCQVDYMRRFIQKARHATPQGDRLVILTFVHGWTHNAKWTDQNFLHLRQAVDCLDWGKSEYARVYSAFLARPGSEDIYDLKCEGVPRQDHVRYIGVYVGWQGTPANQDTNPIRTLLPVFEIAKTTAAAGGIETLFRELGTAAKDGTDDKPAQLIIAGHSMGGLITERVAAKMLTTDQSDLSNPSCENGRHGKVLAIDLFVLINPANNTGVGLNLIDKMKAAQPCHASNLASTLDSPFLISIHSDTDVWTGRIGAYGAHLHSPFEQIPKELAPQKESDRTETPPSRSRLNGRTFNQSPYLLNLCYLGSWSIKRDGTGSPTSDVICDRVDQKIKEAKISSSSANGLISPIQPNGVDVGAFQLLNSICDASAAPGTPTSCDGSRKDQQEKERTVLNTALSDVLAFPQANAHGTPNVLFNLYTRNDPGCRRANDPSPDVAGRPLCQSYNRTFQPTPIPKLPYNQSRYWAFNVPDTVIHGHSAFWSDEFTSLILGLTENLQ